jgi:hypothetical protein
MSAEHGGGSGNGMGFFIALFACVAVAWFFSQTQQQDSPRDDQTASATDALYDTSGNRASRTTTHRSTDSEYSGHGTTYYLDEDGNILDVVRF